MRNALGVILGVDGLDRDPFRGVPGEGLEVLATELLFGDLTPLRVQRDLGLDSGGAADAPALPPG